VYLDDGNLIGVTGIVRDVLNNGVVVEGPSWRIFVNTR
jgi:hypothetical protein